MTELGRPVFERISCLYGLGKGELPFRPNPRNKVHQRPFGANGIFEIGRLEHAIFLA